MSEGKKKFDPLTVFFVVICLFIFVFFYFKYSALQKAKATEQAQQSDSGKVTISSAEPAELPDYAKAPFVPFGHDVMDKTNFHPELGILKIKVYTNNASKELKPGTEDIAIYFKDDDQPVYAEWLSTDGQNINKYTLRGYTFKDGKFVFEIGATQTLP